MKVIAIDGVAGAGKGTLARALAKQLNYLHLDTGAIYRVATVLVLKNKINPMDESAVVSAVTKAKIEVKLVGEVAHFFLNGEDLSKDNQLRTPEVNAVVSKISPYNALREQVRKIQHNIAKKHNIVVEGRDVTTVVFPNAWIKFYIDAPLKVRAKRRQAEFLAQGKKVALKDVINMIIERDKDDTERENCPLSCAPDAHIIMNVGTVEESLNQMLKIVEQQS